MTKITKKKEEAESQEHAVREHEQRKKALEKLVEKVRAHCKLELGAVRSWEVTRAQLTDKEKVGAMRG